MPNHVTNILTIAGVSEEEIRRIKSEISTVDEDGNVSHIDFNNICPIPEELKDTRSPAHIISEEEYLEQEKKNATLSSHFGFGKGITQKMHDELIEKYGYADWYGWQLSNWGTKWNAYSQSIGEDGEITFQTAWSTPEELIGKLSSLYPDAIFEVQYADEDFGYNVGVYSYKGGILLSEDIKDGGSTEAYILAATILDHWDRIIDELIEYEDYEFSEEQIENRLRALYEHKMISVNIPVHFLEMMKEYSIDEENYEMTAEISRMIEDSKLIDSEKSEEVE